ncbi:MAG: rhodanese-like domain-containing protein [Actinomycetota bacterium]|nr:rhodanese-like domain-containing protein [Actinomycetota bacterium]
MADHSPALETDLKTFAAAYESGAPVLDVRNPDEYEAAHVPGAVLIPLGELMARQAEVPEGTPLYVICAAGGRSLTATNALVDAGHAAVSVAGGTNGWIERGGQVVTGPEAG